MNTRNRIREITSEIEALQDELRELKNKSVYGAILTSHGTRKIVIKNTEELRDFLNENSWYNYVFIDGNGYLSFLTEFPFDFPNYTDIEVI